MFMEIRIEILENMLFLLFMKQNWKIKTKNRSLEMTQKLLNFIQQKKLNNLKTINFLQTIIRYLMIIFNRINYENYLKVKKKIHIWKNNYSVKIINVPIIIIIVRKI